LKDSPAAKKPQNFREVPWEVEGSTTYYKYATTQSQVRVFLEGFYHPGIRAAGAGKGMVDISGDISQYVQLRKS
jgi:hypothetical protein